jgi:coenzyme F420-dependent glucose-6-phosphate dehydrogenase
MAEIGFHASHEQFTPRELLDFVQKAQRRGFDAAMSSDHFQPWSEQQGNSGYAWSWLGAAMQATTLPFGVVSTPGWRHHPAVLAQAAATLAQMFPGRFWMALGSGEAMNDHIVGEGWPPKPERNARLKECVEIIRALWAGETVNHAGLVRVDEAKLWVRPPMTPMLIGAAMTPSTAEWAGGWADGLITVNKPREQLKQLVEAFRRGGGAGKPMFLQVHLSYAGSDDEARDQAFDQWRTNILESAVLADLRMPAQFEAAAAFVRPEDLDDHVRISADLDRHVAWLRDDIALGFAGLYLHNVGRNQDAFLDQFGRHVLPRLR